MSQARRHRSVADAFLLELLTRQLDDWQRRSGRSEVHVVDLGGGTGTFASRLADLGYAITVIDPSPDALASLQRRTDDRLRSTSANSPRIRGVQGDASELVELLGPNAADVVVCHRVLEVVDDPAEALRGMAEVLRPGGVLSLVIAQRRSVVLSQAMSGQVELARRTWNDPSRFDLDRVGELVVAAGFRVLATDGVGSVAGYLAESLMESEAGLYSELLALEREVSGDPAFRALAPLAHLFAELPA